MKCENCGNEVREGAKFCSKCGSNILEQQEDHSGKHNVHETKTEKRCVNCGNVLREESKFCPKCGSSTLEQKEDVSTLKDEEKILYARIVTARIRFRLLRTRQRLKQKDTVWGAGAVECVCSVRLDYCAERFSRALK